MSVIAMFMGKRKSGRTVTLNEDAIEQLCQFTVAQAGEIAALRKRVERLEAKHPEAKHGEKDRQPLQAAE